MKGFFKYTLATVLGVIIVSIVGILIMGGIFSAMVSSTQKEVVIKDKSMLELKLSSQISDRAPNDPFQNMDIPGFENYKRLGLDDIISAIDKAKTEDNIKGIFLRLENIGAGYSATEEIRDAIIEFKEESDKFVYAYSETYSQKAYYIATAADKIFINPEGMLMFTGLASNNMFYKKALDKLGVEMQVIRHGKFKAAVEPFILDKMSKENREQVEVYMGSIWNTVLTDISNSRDITVDQLNKIADENMLFKSAEELAELGLVDEIVYEDELLDFLREETGVKANKGIPIATVSDMKNVVAKRKGKGLAKDKVAVVYASGEINVGGSEDGESISGRHIAREIRKARTDSTIKAIVLRVNSPGGSALGSELIWREVKLATEVKPTVVSMGNLAASGGYYIACPADTIVANPTTITGSIGVFGLIPNTQKLFEDKLGIHTEVVKTNKLSDLPSTSRPMTNNEKAIMQNMVEKTYATFVNHVAEGRNMTFEQVDEIGQGRVWTGQNALELGLVDVLGDLDDAINIAVEMADLENYRITKLPKQKDPFQSFIEGFSTQVKYRAIENELGDVAKYYRTLQSLKNKNEILTRIPYGLEIE